CGYDLCGIGSSKKMRYCPNHIELGEITTEFIERYEKRLPMYICTYVNYDIFGHDARSFSY
ncbi:MAG: hypothetical protein ABIK07_10015, partial [Planctomycetota bacterium]